MTVEIRLRTKIADEELQAKVGKILTDEDINLRITGETRVLKPDGRLLCHYLPGAFSTERMAEFYDVLHSLKDMHTDNRGLASGGYRHRTFAESSWTRAKTVASAIIGAFDSKPPKAYCRLTAWTGRENEQFSSLFPLFQDIGALFREHVPDRYAVQMEYVHRTHPEWLVPKTPFSTITVNNTYPTGVHTDKGDLEEGFSTLCVTRRGNYTGGTLCFPEYRVGVDMGDGDVLLMDAHEWHGNTALVLFDPECDLCDDPAEWGVAFRQQGKTGTRLGTYCAAHAAYVEARSDVEEFRWDQRIAKAERISIVSYYRTKMADCGTPEEEAAKAVAWGERRIAVSSKDVLEDMREEAYS